MPSRLRRSEPNRQEERHALRTFAAMTLRAGGQLSARAPGRRPRARSRISIGGWRPRSRAAWNIAATFCGSPRAGRGRSAARRRRMRRPMQTNFHASAVDLGRPAPTFVISGGVEMMSRVPMGSTTGSMSDAVLDFRHRSARGSPPRTIAPSGELSRGESGPVFARVASARRARDRGRAASTRRSSRSTRVPAPDYGCGTATIVRTLFAVRRGRAPDDSREMADAQPSSSRRTVTPQLEPDRRRLGGGARRVGERGVGARPIREPASSAS